MRYRACFWSRLSTAWPQVIFPVTVVVMGPFLSLVQGVSLVTVRSAHGCVGNAEARWKALRNSPEISKAFIRRFFMVWRKVLNNVINV